MITTYDKWRSMMYELADDSEIVTCSDCEGEGGESFYNEDDDDYEWFGCDSCNGRGEAEMFKFGSSHFTKSKFKDAVFNDLKKLSSFTGTKFETQIMNAGLIPYSRVSNHAVEIVEVY